ncbi:MAG: transcription elongation factor GreA [Lachnospiraceae bacterium]|jgi:transcription elongation factor GreA|nr:transcription elongation factor GreA [Lachnospiraceae bacterium]
MEEQKTVLTAEGLKKYEDELEYLKVTKRKEIAEAIKEARAQGDLSENAEYQAAKDEQRKMEARIEELEKILTNVEVVEDNDDNSGVIRLGSKVKIKDIEFDEVLEYRIVGSNEANTDAGQISNESPLGRALIGAKKGKTVEVQAPMGVVKYKVMEIIK